MFFVFAKKNQQFEDYREEWKRENPMYKTPMTRQQAKGFSNYLGYGHFGLVFKAIYNHTEVAVKQV
jgi:hypothetical protein